MIRWSAAGITLCMSGRLVRTWCDEEVAIDTWLQYACMKRFGFKWRGTGRGITKLIGRWIC